MRLSNLSTSIFGQDDSFLLSDKSRWRNSQHKNRPHPGQIIYTQKLGKMIKLSKLNLCLSWLLPYTTSITCSYFQSFLIAMPLMKAFLLWNSTTVP